LKYIAPNGLEKTVDGIAACQEALRMGLMGADTLVLDEASGAWVKAANHPQLAHLFAPVSPAPASAPGGPSVGLQMSVWASWIIGVVGLTAISIGMGADPKLVGYNVGRAVLEAGFIGAVCLILVRRPRGRAILWLVMGCVVCLAGLAQIAVTLAVPRIEHARLQQSAQKLQNALDEAAAIRQAPAPAGTGPAVADVPAAPGATQASVSTQVTTGAAKGHVIVPPSLPAGALGESVQIVPGTPPDTGVAVNPLDVTADAIRESNQLAQRLGQAQAALEPTTVLSLATLAEPTRLRAARARLDAWERFLGSYERDLTQIPRRYESRLLALAPSQSVRAQLRARLETAAAGQVKQVHSFLAIERALVAEVRAVHTIAASGGVLMYEGKPQFATAADKEAVASHLARIQKLGEQETALQQEAARATQQSLENLRAIAREMAR
jgi:hypothetical protein